MNKLTFDVEFEDVLQTGEKTETLRYNVNTVPETGAEYPVYLSNNEKIGRARILETTFITISRIPNYTFEGHINYESTTDVIEHLNEYYHDTIRPTDELLYIKFSFIGTDNMD